MQTPRTWAARIAVIVAIAIGLGLPGLQPASAASPTDEQGFVDLINQARAAQSLAPLRLNVGVVTVARAWSDHMSSADDFRHNPNYASQMPAGWSRAGENIAWGSGGSGTVDALHTALMNSPGHRANILGDYTDVGIGVTVVNGKMWVTEDFGKYASSASSGGGSGVATPTSFTLTVATSGLGSVSGVGILCPSDCNQAYPSDTSVTLTARAKTGRHFRGWGGACTGAATTCTVSMTAAKSVTAMFR
jgi:hypothetical protein